MTDWHEYAACSADSVDPDWFFPDVPGLAGNKAKAICRGCLVLQSCLDFALRNPVVGIWGGTTEPQRVTMRRELGITAPPAGWKVRGSAWERRYYELRDLGYGDLSIAQRLGIQPESLLRQLDRRRIPADPLLVEEAHSRRRRAAAGRSV